MDVTVNAGEPGRGGQPEFGGEGGDGGPGGYGGSGGSGGSGSPSGGSGISGRTGLSGPSGPEGPVGAGGINGMKGRDGGLSFVLLSPDVSTVLEEQIPCESTFTFSQYSFSRRRLDIRTKRANYD